MKFPLLLPLAFLGASAFGDDPRGDHPDAPPSTPQEELARFHVPPGFEVQLVAAEPEIQKPINLNFDAAGRLWVTGSELYPWPAATDPNGQPIPGFQQGFHGIVDGFHVGNKAPVPATEGRDTVRILSDFGPDGHAREVKIFADKLSIPSGIQPLPHGSAAIAAVYGLQPNFDPNPAMTKLQPLNNRHIGQPPKGDSAIVYSIPNIWLMTDWDGDGFAESRVPLYTGFGYTDTHGGSSSYTYWMDGWIYGTHGFRNHSEVTDRNGQTLTVESGNTYRFRPDGSAFEIFAHGQTNPFGLAFDALGNLYSADSHSKPVYMLLRGGYYEGIGKQQDGLGFAPRITDDDHGSSAIGGIACYTDDKWPAEYRGNLFNGNPVTQKINRDKLEWHGTTPQAIRQPDFLSNDDPWFRPVNLRLGPDGALYIADFYNPIIGHYEVPLTHPARDHVHGRIWRVVWTGETPHETAGAAAQNLASLDGPALVSKLGNPSLEVRRLAVNELVDRLGKPAAEFIAPILTQGGSDSAATAGALWALERLGQLDGSKIAQRESLGLQGIRILTERAQPSPADLPQLSAASDPWMLRGLSEFYAQHPSAAGIALIVQELAKLPPNAEDRQLAYALRVSLRDQLIREGYEAADATIEQGPATLAEAVAVVSLAVKTPAAAEFLLDHLARTKMKTRRAGDFLKHAMLYLPAERFTAAIDLVAKLGAAPLPQRVAVAEGLTQAARQRGLTLPAEAIALTEQAMLEALAQKEDAALVTRAVDVLKPMATEAKFAPLTALINDPQRPGKLRTSALEAVQNCSAGPVFIAGILADPATLSLRMKAADLLAQSASRGDTAASTALLAALPTAPTDLAVGIASGLARSDATFAQFLTLVEAGKASPSLLHRTAVANASTTRDAALRARADALTKGLPAEDARLDALIAERVNAFNLAKPDPAHGQRVFEQNCVVCHRFHSVGGNVGPNLDGVVARGTHRLVEDILDPNRNVDPGFRQTTIETNDGRAIVGANLREQPAAVTVTTATGEDVTVPRREIRAQNTSRLSLMPPIFENQIPPADFNDLLAYLLAPAR